MKDNFNNQFATQRLLQEQEDSFYVVYNKGYGKGKGVANDFKPFPSFDAAQAFADERNDSVSGVAQPGQAFYYVDPYIGKTVTVGNITYKVEKLFDNGEYLLVNNDGYETTKSPEALDSLLKKIREVEITKETSTTSGAGGYPTIARKKKQGTKPIAAGKAENYVKDHWGWEEAPSIPNRSSEIIDYKTLWQNKELNENYSRFKKETKTRTNEQQLHAAMRLAEKKIHEANRILEYTAQLRTELTETRTNKNTQRLMEKITRGIAEAYGKMKKLK